MYIYICIYICRIYICIIYTHHHYMAKQPRLVLIFFCLCALVELPIWTPHMRQIPLQRLTFGIWAANGLCNHLDALDALDSGYCDGWSQLMAV